MSEIVTTRSVRRLCVFTVGAIAINVGVFAFDMAAGRALLALVPVVVIVVAVIAVAIRMNATRQ